MFYFTYNHGLSQGQAVHGCGDGDVELVVTCRCRIVRERGIYGDALVRYRITESLNVTTVAVSDVFVAETGLVMFADRQFNAELSVNVLHSGIPHFDLHYIIRLLNVTGLSLFLLEVTASVIC